MGGVGRWETTACLLVSMGTGMLHGRRGLGETLDITFWTKWDVGRCECCGEEHQSFWWTEEVSEVWKEMLRHKLVSPALLLTAWGIFLVIFQQVLKSGCTLLVMDF